MVEETFALPLLIQNALNLGRELPGEDELFEAYGRVRCDDKVGKVAAWLSDGRDLCRPLSSRVLDGSLQVRSKTMVPLAGGLGCDLECDGVERFVVSTSVASYKRLEVFARACHGPPPVVPRLVD